MNTAGKAPASALSLKKRAWRWCISAFVLVHLYIMVFWGMPASRFRAYMTDPINEYVIKTGLWHSWDMFSPDPISMIYRVHAQIHYRDGNMDFWEFPRMEKLGYLERSQKERWRKYRERIRQDAYGVAWDDAARYVARLHNNPTNPPKQIVLVREWDSIPPIQFKPGTFDYKPFQKMPKGYDYLKYSMRFRFYDVTPGDL
ncbi:MAG TPA: hypothetical protein VF773_13470 [Verrucomicrobiae bacterium]